MKCGYIGAKFMSVIMKSYSVSIEANSRRFQKITVIF